MMIIADFMPCHNDSDDYSRGYLFASPPSCSNVVVVTKELLWQRRDKNGSSEMGSGSSESEMDRGRR